MPVINSEILRLFRERDGILRSQDYEFCRFMHSCFMDFIGIGTPRWADEFHDELLRRYQDYFNRIREYDNQIRKIQQSCKHDLIKVEDTPYGEIYKCTKCDLETHIT